MDIQETGYRQVYPLAGVFTLLAALQFRKIHVRREQSEIKQGSPRLSPSHFLRIFLSDVRFRRYQYSFIVFGFANLMIIPVFWKYLDEGFHVSYTDAGFVLVSLPSLLHILFLPLWEKILDRGNPLLLRSLTTAVTIIYPLACWAAHDLWLIYLGMAIVGVSRGGGMLTWILGINYFARKEKVLAYTAIHQTFTGVRGLVAPFAGIGLANWIGLRNTFLVSAVLMAVGSLILWTETIREKRIHGLRSYLEKERFLDGEED